MSMSGRKRRYLTTSSPNESDNDNSDQPSSSNSQLSTKRRGSVAADFAPPRFIVSERQQLAVLKQLTAGDESNPGSQSPLSITPQPRPSKINRRNEHGETIVHIAARKGDIKQLKKVLKAGANINEADNAGWTPLHEAVTKNQFKAACFLLKSGANSNAPGPDGQTPLVDAVLNNNPKMAELLIKYSADPSVINLTRVNETMLKVLKRETTLLDSSDNENDDEPISPLSPLTSDNDCEHDDKQNFHSKLVEKLDNNLSSSSTHPKFQRKKEQNRDIDRSLQSSDSLTGTKNRNTTNENNESSSSSIAITITDRNPYDFESEEEIKTQERSNEMHDDHKKKLLRKQNNSKQRTYSGSSIQTNDNSTLIKQTQNTDFINEDTQLKSKSTSDDEQCQQTYRVPRLKIVLSRTMLQKSSENESLNSSTMCDDINNNENNLVIDTSSSTNEQNEKSPDLPVSSSDIEEKSNETNQTKTNLNEIDIEQDDKSSSDSDVLSPETVILSIIHSMIADIETAANSELNSLPVIEEDPMEVEEEEEDDDDENEEDDDDDEQTTSSDRTSSNKSNQVEKERLTAKISTLKYDLNPTRTLRSHARRKGNVSTSVETSSNTMTHARRVSNRRRVLESKSYLVSHEKERKRITISDRSKKDKDNTTTNDDAQTSSNSDDQINENTNVEKISNATNNPNDDASSCSSIGAGDASSTSSSTMNVKQSHSTNDIDTLPPNKRRAREKNQGTPHTPITTDTSNNSNSTSNTDNTSLDTISNREIPVNSIKQFLEIRQQIDKRHETMLNEFILPKIPKDFNETTMAKKTYLVSPRFSSYSTTTPSTLGIRRLLPPNDLDAHLCEVFAKQEDERYRMKIRHQVERDKLILSHEQEVLRLCGNATRSSSNQDVPFSYCSLLKDNEVYNNPSIQAPEKFINNDYNSTELGKRGKHRWNGRSFIKWLDDSNLKYKRLSCELNERQRLEADTLYSMQRMVWLKHLPKDSLSSSTTGRTSYLLSERYLPRVDIILNFWTNWETSPF